jgi:hypothetical protein
MASETRIGGVFVEFEPMSPEDIQRTMQFLLLQQTQFAADLARYQDESAAGDARLSTKMDRLADGVIGLTGIVGHLQSSQQLTEQQLRETDARLSEHLKTVESHLDVVIQMFERHLREDHGRPPS